MRTIDITPITTYNLHLICFVFDVKIGTRPLDGFRFDCVYFVRSQMVHPVFTHA